MFSFFNKQKATPQPEKSADAPTGNQPITAQQLFELQPQYREVLIKDRQGNTHVKRIPIAVVAPQFPNNRTRRMDKQKLHGHRNAKANKARSYQLVDVTAPEKTEYGVINVPTGLIRKVMHNKVLAKESIFQAQVTDKIWGSKKLVPVKEERKAA